MNSLKAIADRSYGNLYSDQLADRLRTERIQSTFSAMSYLNNTSDAFELADKYDKVAIQNESPSGTELSAIASRNEARNTYAKALTEEKITPEIFNTSNMPEGYCLPYRHFIASKQFPMGEEFYQGLETFTSFNDDQWNYLKIMSTLRGPLTDGFEAAMKNDPKVASRYYRARFLHDNPVLKNIFLSHNEKAKADLFKIIKNMPRPACTNNICARTDDWAKEMEAYRREMAGFLASDNAIKANEEGNAIAGEINYNAASKAAVLASETSDILLGQKIVDAGEWAGYCRIRSDLMQRNDVTKTIPEIERDFGTRNFRDLQSDGEFQRFNNDICGAKRKDPKTNREDTFFTFFQRECTGKRTPRCSIESRGALIGEFLTRYSVSSDSVGDSEAQLLLPFLKGTVGGPQMITRSDAENYNKITNDPTRAARPVRFTSREYASLTPATTSGAQASVSRAPASLTSNVSPQATSNANGSTQIQPSFSSIDPAFIGPNRPQNQAPPTSQVIQSNLDKGESDAKEIRQQISSLREVIGKDNSQVGPRDSKEFSGLTARLDALERQLAEKERSNQALRDQLDQQRVAESSQKTNSSGVNRQDALNRSSASASSTQSVAPQGGATAGFNAVAPSLGGGASLNSGVGGGVLAPVTRSPSSGSGMMNSALLSRYGIQPSSSEGGITVADGSSKINYQQLASDSGSKSVIEVPFSLADVQRLSGEEIGKYTPKSNGVYPIAFNDGSAGFLVRDGDQISVVPGQTEIARVPASIESAPLEPSVRLRDLQRELGQ
ncbi:MAG: hypothetical protein ACJ76H_10000 [Bacteriovoracaceae bacterium]